MTNQLFLRMAWCRQSAIHCLNQCWPSPMISYGVISLKTSDSVILWERVKIVSVEMEVRSIEINSRAIRELTVGCPACFCITTSLSSYEPFELKHEWLCHKAMDNSLFNMVNRLITYPFVHNAVLVAWYWFHIMLIETPFNIKTIFQGIRIPKLLLDKDNIVVRLSYLCNGNSFSA